MNGHKETMERAWRRKHLGLGGGGRIMEGGRIMVGRCNVFFRKGHAWHGDTVAVIREDAGVFTVARASDVCEHFLSGAENRRPFKTWTATAEELW